jgi:pimeloyl-ACP methyl ester carboxylesterase
VYCLIHGKWHDGSCWDEFAPLLADDVVAPTLPLDDPRTTYRERIQPALDALDGRPATIVAHSLGAAYAPLLALELPGSTIVYLCPPPVAPLRVEGAPPGYREDFPFPKPTPEGLSIWDPDAALAAMYSRVPRDKALAAVARLRPDAPASGEYPLTTHPDIPARLVYCADDEFFQPDWERWTARNVLDTEPIELEGGHFPMLADPEGLAGAIRALA